MVARLRRTARGIAVGLAWLSLLCASAAVVADVVIRAPVIRAVPAGLELATQLQFDLPPEVEQALLDGAVLDLSMVVRVSRQRRWWPDATLGEVEPHYELQFHRVSGRYLLRDVSRAGQRTFITLTEALVSLRQVQQVLLPDLGGLPISERDVLNLRVRVALHSIPSVLKVLLFWRSEFTLQSAWYSWPLTWTPSLQAPRP